MTRTTCSMPIASAHASGPRGWLRPSTIPSSTSSAPRRRPPRSRSPPRSRATRRSAPGRAPARRRPTRRAARASARSALRRATARRTSRRRGSARAGRRRAAAGPREKPTAGPPSSCARERALGAQQHPRRALQRLVLLAARVDRDERHLAVRVAGRRDAPPRARRASCASSTATGSSPAMTTSPSPPPGSGAVSSSRGTGRPSGYAYQPRPDLRPRWPASTLRRCSGDGRHRGSWKLCSKNEHAISRPTSMPTRSMSSNGPMRKPPPSRQMRSTCSGVASPSCDDAQRLERRTGGCSGSRGTRSRRRPRRRAGPSPRPPRGRPRPRAARCPRPPRSRRAA